MEGQTFIPTQEKLTVTVNGKVVQEGLIDVRPRKHKLYDIGTTIVFVKHDKET